MRVGELSTLVNAISAEAVSAAGEDAHALVRTLFPLPRSITGPGLRSTVNRLAEWIPLQVTEVPSGTRVFDWTIPDEWTIEDAYLEHESGRRFAEFSQSSLHLVSYSLPVDEWMTLEQLRPYLHSLPAHPEWIPYRTSYYSPTWGFCLPDRELSTLPAGRYRVVIRARLAPGSLTLAECSIAGQTDEEVLVFAHDCHPALANDNLSGIAVAVELARFLLQTRPRYTYRFLFAPATIGSLAWLATHEPDLGRIRHGLVLSLLGGPGPLHYKRSRRGDHSVDRAAGAVLGEFPGSRVLEFSPWGYDERQFCSPGINLPMGRLTRTPNGEFPEYHTSADHPGFLTADALGHSWLACLKIFAALESEARYRNLSPKGEPQLGRRGLYKPMGGHHPGAADQQMALLWMLNFSDGDHSLLDIALRSGLPVGVLDAAARDLEQAGLLARLQEGDSASR